MSTSRRSGSACRGSSYATEYATGREAGIISISKRFGRAETGALRPIFAERPGFAAECDVYAGGQPGRVSDRPATERPGPDRRDRCFAGPRCAWPGFDGPGSAGLERSLRMPLRERCPRARYPGWLQPSPRGRRRKWRIPNRPAPSRPVPGGPLPARPLPARPLPDRPLPDRPAPGWLGLDGAQACPVRPARRASRSC